MSSLMKKRRNQNEDENKENDENGHDNENSMELREEKNAK